MNSMGQNLNAMNSPLGMNKGSMGFNTTTSNPFANNTSTN